MPALTPVDCAALSTSPPLWAREVIFKPHNQQSISTPNINRVLKIVREKNKQTKQKMRNKAILRKRKLNDQYINRKLQDFTRKQDTHHIKIINQRHEVVTECRETGTHS